jgi:hypothetical protein
VTNDAQHAAYFVGRTVFELIFDVQG